jgi:hypothetical protein
MSDGKLFAVGILVIILFAFCLGYYSERIKDDYSKECEARGGKAVFIRSGSICVDPKTFK